MSRAAPGMNQWKILEVLTGKKPGSSKAEIATSITERFGTDISHSSIDQTLRTMASVGWVENLEDRGPPWTGMWKRTKDGTKKMRSLRTKFAECESEGV